MTAISLPRRWLPIAALAVGAACGDSIGLPPATAENFVDTATIYALQGTDVSTPSGYDVAGRSPTRTHLGEPFDFAFDIDTTGTPVLLPSGALGRNNNAGLQPSELPFDSIIEAPTDGYEPDSVLTIDPGMTFLARSRAVSSLCGFLGALPRYGKFRILEIDETTRTVTFEHLVNRNCGYRQLEPGIPTS